MKFQPSTTRSFLATPSAVPEVVVYYTVHTVNDGKTAGMLSVNGYDFPSGLAEEQYVTDKWFIRAGLNLEA